MPAVVIERYDRSPDAPQGRIHQEDFNQVLGAAGNQKYQKYGGKVSLERIARVFSAIGDRDSLERLFKLVVVSVAVGNLDLHAKNVSLLHRPDGSMTLSPAYDVVPQAHQPNDGEVALAVGGEYRHAAITMEPPRRRGTRVGAHRRQPTSPRRRSPRFSTWRARRSLTDGLMLGSLVTSERLPPTCSPAALPDVLRPTECAPITPTDSAWADQTMLRACQPQGSVGCVGLRRPPLYLRICGSWPGERIVPGGCHRG